MLTYPESQLQRVDDLLNLLGSFWATSFAEQSEVLPSLLYARAQRDMQSHLNLLELVASMSRFKIPVFHTENWFPLVLLESETNLTDRNTVKYGEDYAYTESGELTYGQDMQRPGFSWTVPDTLADVRVILNRITRSSKTLLEGSDFSFDAAAHVITFAENPFSSDMFTTVDILSGNEVIDRRMVLWAYRGKYDWQNVFNQFGYALGLYAKSSENYKALINAVFDSLVEGTTIKSVQNAWSALCDVPLARGDETVESIVTMPEKIAVVTDKNVYEFPPTANVVVAVGDTLRPGDGITDALRFFELNRGEVPETVTSLCVGPGLLASGYFGDLVFDNVPVDLVVEENVQGFTKVSFPLGGLFSDVEKFWDDVHAAGVSNGRTLAMLLDTRNEPATQPTAAALPQSVNPLAFLIANVLRNNAYLVVLRPSSFGPNAIKLPYSVISRRTVPPHTLGIVLVELVNVGETFRINDTATEQAVLLPLLEASATFDVGSLTESVRLRRVNGRCI